MTIQTPTVVTSAYVNGSVSVTTAATAVCTIPAGNGGAVVRNGGSASIFLGGSAVTTATGFAVASSASQIVPSGKGNDRTLYAIGTATTTVTYLIPE